METNCSACFNIKCPFRGQTNAATYCMNNEGNKDSEQPIEIPLGAKDSEMIGFTYYIPEGMDAVIENGKVVVRKKESKDERIRNFLISKMEEVGNVWKEYSAKDIIAWLEKQGEHANFRNKIQVGDYVTRNQDGLLVNLSRLNRTAEKRGEKQGKKKTADKVKPTFKVGDWVVNTITKEVEQVIEITDHEYVCSGHLIISFDNQHLLNRWTIQDAKDGDVLYTPKGCGVEGIFLIEGWKQVDGTGRTLCSDIGYRVEDDEIIAGGLGSIWWEGVIDPFYPATKEQRDLLFQKMKEAGYEWDAEKKELKKLAPKCDTCTNDKGCVTCVDGDQWEGKLTWSEEDEMFVHGLIRGLAAKKDIHGHTTFSSDCIDITDTINWLKSLKDRVQSQPQQEWSEEDGDYYDAIIAKLEVTQDDAALTNNQMEFLKSLKYRYTLKPTEEQMEVLVWCKPLFADPKTKGILESLINDLKKLM